MTGIVEAVALAAWQARRITKDGEDIFDRLLAKEAHLAVGRAAIRATLEYARDNVSPEMACADPGTCTTDMHAFYSAKFRAMITALLAELDRESGK